MDPILHAWHPKGGARAARHVELLRAPCHPVAELDGPLIREIRAQEDLHALGFNKANPNAHFDFTPYVQQLQAERSGS